LFRSLILLDFRERQTLYASLMDSEFGQSPSWPAMMAAYRTDGSWAQVIRADGMRTEIVAHGRFYAKSPPCGHAASRGCRSGGP